MVAPPTRVARRFIVTTTVSPGYLALRSTASAHGTRLISGDTMGAATSFTSSTTMTELITAKATSTTVMPAAAMAAVDSKHLAPAPRTSEQVHHVGCAKHHRDGSQLRRIADRVRQFYKIHNGTKQPIWNAPGMIEIAEWLQVASANPVGPVMPTAHESYRFMAKYSNHYIKLKVVYFISTKDKALTTFVHFMQDFVMPLRRCL